MLLIIHCFDYLRQVFISNIKNASKFICKHHSHPVNASLPYKKLFNLTSNIQIKAEANNSKTNRQFVPKAKNFEVSTSYEGLTAKSKPQSLEALKRQYAR